MGKGEQGNFPFLIQDYLEAILENFHDGIYITDNEANTVYLNHSYELISGLLKSEMIGRNMKDLVARGVISRSGTLAVLETRDTFTAEQSFRTGKRAIITSTPIFEEGNNSENIIMVVTIVREITEIYSIRRELRRKEQLNRTYLQEVERIQREMTGNTEIVAVDKKSIGLMRVVERVSMVDNPILLSGDNGVGKEKMAEFIHKHSERSEFSFLRINFSVIPEAELMGYLFGIYDEKSGEYRMGMLESAERGTIYIEELSEIPLKLQIVLLELIREGACVLGDGTVRKLNVRVIAGSVYSLEELKSKSIINREILDIFSLFPLEVVPLRERKEDIVPLLDFFLNQHNKKTGENKKFDRDSYKILLDYHWPGNVLELKNLVQRAAIISPEDIIGPQDLFIEENIEFTSKRQEELLEKYDLKEEIARLEASYMEKAFKKYRNTRLAAESLGMDSSTFVRKRQKYEKAGLMKERGKKALK